MKKERIPLQEFVEKYQDLDEEFRETVEGESLAYAVRFCLMEEYYDLLPGFGYERVDTREEKGDGYDESTTTTIFKRSRDGKYFQLWVHDDGTIGPESLTVADYLEEVTLRKKTITEWS